MSSKTLGSPGVFLLWLEFFALFGGAPLLILHERRPGLLFLALWGGGGVALYRASRPAAPALTPSLHTIMRRLALIAPFRIGLALMFVPTTPSAFDLERRRQTRGILIRFFVLGLLLTAVMRVFAPAMFLQLPRQHFWFWLLIMLLYPLLSVWPQEVIYRRFLFHRYRPIFGNGLPVASALTFGFAHVIFLNWIALALTTAGGALFARQYARYRSLSLACLEHSLYGCLVFTIGLGRFFYTGAAWHH